MSLVAYPCNRSEICIAVSLSQSQMRPASAAQGSARGGAFLQWQPPQVDACHRAISFSSSPRSQQLRQLHPCRVPTSKPRSLALLAAARVATRDPSSLHNLRSSLLGGRHERLLLLGVVSCPQRAHRARAGHEARRLHDLVRRAWPIPGPARRLAPASAGRGARAAAPLPRR